MRTHSFIKGICLIAICAMMLSSCHSRNNSRDSSVYDYEEELDSYKSIETALQDGDVTYGMTYEQISKICGMGDDVYRVNGVVRTVTYHAGLGGATLYFTDAGRFYQYTSSY